MAYTGKTTALLLTRAHTFKRWVRTVDWYQVGVLTVLLALAGVNALPQVLNRLSAAFNPPTVYVLVQPTQALEVPPTSEPIIIERLVVATPTALPAPLASDPVVAVEVPPAPAEAEPTLSAPESAPAAIPPPSIAQSAPPAPPVGWGGGSGIVIVIPTPGLVDRAVGAVHDAVQNVTGPPAPTMPPNGWGGGGGKGW